MSLFRLGPERVTVYFCKQCERQTVSGDYQPVSCPHCENDSFWSEFDDEAPCNRHQEEENLNEEDEYFWDGEYTFQLKKVS